MWGCLRVPPDPINSRVTAFPGKFCAHSSPASEPPHPHFSLRNSQKGHTTWLQPFDPQQRSADPGWTAGPSTVVGVASFSRPRLPPGPPPASTLPRLVPSTLTTSPSAAPGSADPGISLSVLCRKAQRWAATQPRPPSAGELAVHCPPPVHLKAEADRKEAGDLNRQRPLPRGRQS